MRRGHLSLGLKDVFDPKGRIDRLTYFIYGLVLRIISVILAGTVFFLASFLGDVAETYVEEYSTLAKVVIALPLLYGVFCVYAKRLHDLNMPAALGVLGFIDIILTVISAFISNASMSPTMAYTIMGIVVFVIVAFHLLLLFVPGTKGENRYGLNNLGSPRPTGKILEG